MMAVHIHDEGLKVRKTELDISVAKPSRSTDGFRLWFVITIFTGSLLLFLVQPMIARMALPRFGGAPAVWNSAMLVYQALLLAGYAYAHWLGYLAPRRQALTHLCLFAVAALMLPIGLNLNGPGPGANPVLWVPLLLLISIGPLFFVISAQAPLMQRWFALSGGGDPYPLYAASNLGSFVGLLAYPLAVEPTMKAVSQSWLWSIGYGALAMLTLLCAVRLPRTASPVATSSTSQASGFAQMLRWVGLAAIPSGLMLSTTQHLTTDVVAMPLIWVIPLGLYLLSFSVAFAENRAFANAISLCAPLFLLFTACTAFAGLSMSPIMLASLVVITMFAVAVALHARMFDSRPQPEHLTRFYLMMSVGGVIGGLFCALLAPLLFDWIYEYPILLLAAALAMTHRPVFDFAARFWADRKSRWPAKIVVLLAVGLAALFASGLFFPVGKYVQSLIAISLVTLGVFCFGDRIVFPTVVAVCMFVFGGREALSRSLNEEQMSRSYFGVYWVRRTEDASFLFHGTTLHGIQMRSHDRENMPTSYFGPDSGIGAAMKSVPSLFGPEARVSILGLGAGALACYAHPGQTWRFYEIDPLVERIARDERHFTYLSRCLPDADITIGDARLAISSRSAHAVDLLAMDAFSSDMVPMHLLTREAFDTYRRYIGRNGLLMVNISNRYLDLKPVIAAAAQEGWTVLLRSHSVGLDDERLYRTSSEWVAMSPDPATIDALVRANRPGFWKPLSPAPDFEAWTDDYGSILPLMKSFQSLGKLKDAIVQGEVQSDGSH
jgi:hypothetical protein